MSGRRGPRRPTDCRRGVRRPGGAFAITVRVLFERKIICRQAEGPLSEPSTISSSPFTPASNGDKAARARRRRISRPARTDTADRGPIRFSAGHLGSKTQLTPPLGSYCRALFLLLPCLRADGSIILATSVICPFRPIRPRLAAPSLSLSLY